MAAETDRPLYLISSDALRNPSRFLAALDSVLDAAGPSIGFVQLRERWEESGEHTAVELASKTRERCHAAGVKVMISRNALLVAVSGADGVHLGADCLPIPGEQQAAIAANRLIVGYSAHSEPELSQQLFPAMPNVAVDHFLLAPIFDPLSKPASRSPLGLEQLSRLAARTDRLVFALGGVTAERAASCRKAGASGVAMLSGVFCAERPSDAARDVVTSWKSAMLASCAADRR